MTLPRLILAATLAAVTLVGWFLLSIARLARQLELSGTAGPSQRDASQSDDSDVVGMPTWRIVGGVEVTDPVRTESSAGWCGSCGAWYIPGGLHICTPRPIYGSASWRTNG